MDKRIIQKDLLKTNSQVTEEMANMIWQNANILRNSFKADKYGDIIIPMTIVRRFECSLEDTKDEVLEAYNGDNDIEEEILYAITGKQYYNTSHFNLKELLNEEKNMVENFYDYIDGFSDNVKEILELLNLKALIKEMKKNGCLYAIINSFSSLDLYEETFDSIHMGGIFENIIGRFYQNVDAGQYYTGRDIIKLMVSILVSEGFDKEKDNAEVITILDQACGTGGMLSTAESFIKEMYPNTEVKLYGQEVMSDTYAIGRAEMLMKGQDVRNYRHVDSLQQDAFPEIKMNFVIENPPYGTAWKGEKAKAGQERAVKAEHDKGFIGRYGAGLPAGSDSQLLFMQSAVDKMNEKEGRAAIVSNGSPLFTGATTSGESQIRKWLLEEDLVEAIISLPEKMFYNTSIATYIWILSKNKSERRKGKVQLIDASNIFHSLRKSAGDKSREFKDDDIEKIVGIYKDFKDSELSQIHDANNFLYREYTIMEPSQRTFAINDERIEELKIGKYLDNFFNKAKYEELFEMKENMVEMKKSEEKNLDKFSSNKDAYYSIFEILESNKDDKKYLSEEEFRVVIEDLLSDLDLKKNIINNVISGLSVQDKEGVVETDKKGNIIYNKANKDTELVPFNESIDDYMEREILPHLKDAKAFFDEEKIGAEIPFTKYFYKYEKPIDSKKYAKDFKDLEDVLKNEIDVLFEGV